MLTPDEKARLLKAVQDDASIGLAVVLIAMIVVIVCWDAIDDWLQRRRKR